jgi:hypothetical protein
MAQMTQGRAPAPMSEAAQTELRRDVKAEQAEAKDRLDEQKKRYDDQKALDEARTKAQLSQEATTQASLKAAQAAAREAFLKTPLTADEMTQYTALVQAANSRVTPAIESMRLLGDFRIRLKNNGVANPA